MLSEIRTGPIVSVEAGVNPARGSKDGSLVVGAGMADYQELAYRGQVFYAANQAAQATSVALATAYTGLVVSNPIGSGKNLILLQLGVAVAGAPVALAVIGIMGNFHPSTAVVHTTPLIPASTLLNGASGSGAGKADASATLPVAPLVIMPLGVTPLTGATAQVVNPPVVLNVYDIKGSIILPPGGFAALYTSTALSVFAGMTWAEVAI